MLVFVMMLVPSFATAAVALPPAWTRTLDPGMLDLGQGVAVDGHGNVIVTGIAEVAAGQAAVTIKLTPDGNVEWSRAVSVAGRDRGDAVVADADGNVFVAVSSRGAGGDDVLVRKYDQNGTTVWSHVMDKGTSESSRGIALAPDGSVFVTGVSLSQHGGDGFILKLTPEGEEEWAQAINVFYLDEMFDVDVDADGHAVVAGRVVRDGGFDVIVRKFAPDGKTQWTKYVRTPAREEGRGVAVDVHGNVWVSGTRTVPTPDGARTDLLLAKFASNGDLSWERSMDLSGANDEGRDVLADASGNVFVTGFGNFSGTKDAFVMKLDADGKPLWRHVWRGGGIDGAGALAASADDRFIAAAGAAQRAGSEFDYLVLLFDQEPPSASFKVSTRVPQAGEDVGFEDVSAPGREQIVSWSWDFGDGNVASGQNPVHAFTEPGEHVVRLTVRDALGTTSTHALSVIVQRAATSLPGATTDTDAPTGDGAGDGDDGTSESTSGSGRGWKILGVVVVLAGLAAASVFVRGRLRK